MRIAFFGGLYNNHRALDAAIRDARGRGVERTFCLGDLSSCRHEEGVFLGPFQSV